MPPKKKVKIKKQTLLEKFREEELIMVGKIIPKDSKRPFTPKAVDTVKECEVWRREIIYDISEKIEQIADPNLNDFLTRELNDQINKLVSEKRVWELRIKELGGPDYIKLRNNQNEFNGVSVPGTKGYKYYGRSKTLPGVKELFEQASTLQEKIKPEELVERVDCDYFGFRDEEDGLLLAYETEHSEFVREQIAIQYSDVKGMEEDVVPYQEIPSQEEIEQWILEKKRKDLEKRFLL